MAADTEIATDGDAIEACATLQAWMRGRGIDTVAIYVRGWSWMRDSLSIERQIGGRLGNEQYRDLANLIARLDAEAAAEASLDAAGYGPRRVA